MKRFLATLFLVALPVVASAATADCPNDTSKSCTTFFDSLEVNATSDVFNLNGFYKISLQISSVAGSTATINVYRRNSSGDPWVTVLQIVDPSATELGYDMTPIGDVKFELFWTAGTIKGTLVRAK